MNMADSDERARELNKILAYLSKEDAIKDAKDRREVFQKLEKIYYIKDKCSYYRHMYSDIFAVVTSIDAMEDCSIEQLGINLRYIMKAYKAVNRDDKGNKINIGNCIIKLYDHVNLDIARLNYTKAIAARALTPEKLNEVKEEIRSLEKQNADVMEKVNSSQRDYISILGIFASIVLAFTGGMTFSASVMQNIGGASIYRLLAVIDLLGCVLINTVYLLVRFIASINNREIRGYNIKYVNYVCLLIFGAIFMAWLVDISSIRAIIINFF